MERQNRVVLLNIALLLLLRMDNIPYSGNIWDRGNITRKGALFKSKVVQFTYREFIIRVTDSR